MRNGGAETVADLVEAGRVHRRVYADPDVFELEMERIFGRAWLFVGHTSQVPNPGDYFTTELGRQPVVMTRHRDGSVNVLFNRCTHRGAKVVNERCGHAARMTCLYHGWSYDTDGTLVAAAIYDPTRNEFFAAERGLGAWLNGKQFHVSRIPQLAESLVATGFPSRKRNLNPNIHFYQEFTMRSHGVRRAGSAALDLAYVAAGRIDGFWEFGLSPWDTAAGTLLIQEAGGRVGTPSGSEYALGPNVIAGNPKVYQALLDALGPLTPATLRG